MKKVMVLLLFMATTCFFLQAQQNPAFRVEVSSDSVLMGNMIKVAFTLENARGEDFQAPYFSEFNVVSGPNVSSSFSMVNGETSQMVTYTYYLSPRDVGNYYIEPASIAAEGEIMETLPIEVIVVPNPDGIIQEPDAQGSPFNFHMEEFSWPDFPSFDFTPRPSPPKQEQKKKRKTYRM